MKLNWSLLIMTILKLIFSIYISCQYSHIVASNTNALNLLVSVFSILAGFLFLVITLASSVALPHSGLRVSEERNQRERFEQRSARYSSLFVGYLFVLLSIFIYFLIPKNGDIVQLILEHIMTFSACFIFLKSLTLPWKMKGLALEAIEIEKKKLH